MPMQARSERINDEVHFIIECDGESVRIPFEDAKAAVEFARGATEYLLFAAQVAMTEDEIFAACRKQDAEHTKLPSACAMCGVAIFEPKQNRWAPFCTEKCADKWLTEL